MKVEEQERADLAAGGLVRSLGAAVVDTVGDIVVGGLVNLVEDGVTKKNEPVERGVLKKERDRT